MPISVNFLTLSLLLGGCFDPDARFSSTGDDSTSTTTTQTETTSSTTGYTTAPIDLDLDGYSEADGDCDDNDSSIYPGATEICDEKDNDCDGTEDEGATGDDEHEPNESDSAAQYLGSLETIAGGSIEGLIDSESDEDWFYFYAVDETDFGFDSFNFTIFLNPPANVDIAFALYFSEEGTAPMETIAFIDDASEGASEVYEHEGTSILEDSGEYYIHIYTESGTDCLDPYQLIISADL